MFVHHQMQIFHLIIRVMFYLPLFLHLDFSKFFYILLTTCELSIDRNVFIKVLYFNFTFLYKINTTHAVFACLHFVAMATLV